MSDSSALLGHCMCGAIGVTNAHRKHRAVSFLLLSL